jgi:predicted DNA-binding transcriptional regulator YafY
METIVEYDKSEGRALRLLELYFYIEENPGVKADTLAAAFKIGIATLYRDIQSLKKMGIQVNYETPNRGGYHIDRGSIRFARIKPYEIKPLLMAQSILQNLAFPDGDIFNRLVEQIVGTVRDGELERTRQSLGKYLFLRTPMNRRFSLDSEHQAQFLSDLLRAAENQWSIQLEYPRSQELASRVINPLGLWFGHNAWYLAAWDQKRKGYRTFAVDRIQGLKILENKPFNRPEQFDLAAWIETSWNAMPLNAQDSVEVVQLHFEYEVGVELAQSFWHQSQQFEIPERATEPVVASFRLGKTSLETEFLSWVRSFGPKVRVLAPAWLQQKLEDEK